MQYEFTIFRKSIETNSSIIKKADQEKFKEYAINVHDGKVNFTPLDNSNNNHYQSQLLNIAKEVLKEQNSNHDKMYLLTF